MKSVTVKDRNGLILLKVVQKENGRYEIIKHSTLTDLDIEVRDDKNFKVLWDK